MQPSYTREWGGREPTARGQDRVKNCHAARQNLVEHRSSLITAMSHSQQHDQTEAHIDLIIRIQSAIDVIDKAIDDEKGAVQGA